MNYEVEINNLKARVDSLQESLIQMGINNNDTTDKAYEGYNKANALEPYKDTKTAYIGDTEVVFENVPTGNLSIFIEPNCGFTFERVFNTVNIYFVDTLDEVTNVTISIQ